ncbi:MAG: hypothetical protein SGBAC_013337, partial [Bacillariaceae sp.]
PLGSESIDDILKETENLMQDLDVDVSTDSAAMVYQGFSIDSDGEEDAPEDSNTNSKVDMVDHPLSDHLLSAPTAPDQTAQLQMMAQPGSNTIAGVRGTQEASNVTMDAFKQQTSRFAFNIASMAQRAAREVAAATNTVPMTGTPVQGAPVVPTQVTPHPAGSNQQNPSLTGDVQESQGNNAGFSAEQTQSLIKDHFGDLLPNERVIMFLPNLLHVSDTAGVSYFASNSSGTSMWCCVLTYYRIILFTTAGKQQLEMPPPAEWNPLCWPIASFLKCLELPLGCIDRIEKAVYQAGGSSYMGLMLTSKDSGRVIRFTTQSYLETGRAFEQINTYAFPGRKFLGYLFAFESKRNEVMASITVNEAGQQTITIPPTAKRFDATVEFPRLLSKTSITQSPWVIWGSLNAGYQLSPTYPSLLVGPATLDETQPESQHVIRQCAAFRSERRLPSLAWCGTGGASIWRCAQPKVGLQGNRSPADELFLRHIAESARGANAMTEQPPVYSRGILQQLTGDYAKDWVPEHGCSLKILDLRPRSAAMANRTGGYGYENTSNYMSTTLQFCNIGNIHAVRDSYQKLCTLCTSRSTADVNWNSLVEDTKWLSHIRVILAASWETAYWVHVWRMPVLLHCSHGWDRTSQVSALAQLLLDPYYRTRHGFSVLVEKDFMSFGHPFHTRCAHGEGRGDKVAAHVATPDEGQISPVFLQFVDCVYQIVQQYPECFEFNTAYLKELSFNIYNNRFGSMLCDSEKDREVAASIRQRTYSVWDHLDESPTFKSEDYTERAGVLLMPLPMLLRNVKLWKERHCFYGPKATLR